MGARTMTLLQYDMLGSRYWDSWRAESTSCASSMEVACAQDVGQASPEPRMVLSFIQSGKRRFVLREGIGVNLNWDGALWVCEFDDLHLMGYGYTREQAVTRFMEDFAVTYDGLVGAANDDLTEDAIEARDKLIALVGRVTDAGDNLDVDYDTRCRRVVSSVSLFTTR